MVGQANTNSTAAAVAPSESSTTHHHNHSASGMITASRFRTNLCKNFMEEGACPYSSHCMFAHGEGELRTIEDNLADGLTTEDAIKVFLKKKMVSLQRRNKKKNKKAKKLLLQQQQQQQHHEGGEEGEEGEEFENEASSVAGCGSVPHHQVHMLPPVAPAGGRVYSFNPYNLYLLHPDDYVYTDVPAHIRQRYEVYNGGEEVVEDAYYGYGTEQQQQQQYQPSDFASAQTDYSNEYYYYVNPHNHAIAVALPEFADVDASEKVVVDLAATSASHTAALLTPAASDDNSEETAAAAMRGEGHAHGVAVGHACSVSQFSSCCCSAEPSDDTSSSCSSSFAGCEATATPAHHQPGAQARHTNQMNKKKMSASVVMVRGIPPAATAH